MENLQNPENREAVIERLIEELATAEDMNPEDIVSDILTFVEILEVDEDAKGYFEDLAEKLGISLEEVMEFAKNKSQEN